jgi:serine phosphatase RsbU (regulator of sigma subunit)
MITFFRVAQVANALVRALIGDVAQHDDMTLVALQVLPG